MIKRFESEPETCREAVTMTEEERARLLAELEQLLERAGLGFVVTQERVIAAEGTALTSEEIRRRDIPSSQKSRFGVRRPWGSLDDDVTPRPVQQGRLKSEDVIVNPLDVRSRLGLLLDLVEVATAGTVAMELAVTDELGVVSSERSVTFDNPPEAELRRTSLEPWRLSEGNENEYSVRNVVETIQGLRAIAEVPRGEWLAAHSLSDDDYPWAKRER